MEMTATQLPECIAGGTLTVGDLRNILSGFPDELPINFGYGFLNINHIAKKNDLLSVNFKEAFVVVSDLDDM